MVYARPGGGTASCGGGRMPPEKRSGRACAETEDESIMKLLSVAVPCYNSQDYMAHAVESLLSGGDEVEILIVDDGSSDATARIADDYERRYPGIVHAVHKENGGHGDAVMTGLAHASGRYFKVVDSDDWVDAGALKKVLETLRAFGEGELDMLISNYVYDKVCAVKKHTVRYLHALPRGRLFGWEEARHFFKGQYILMHSVIYRTSLLRECGLTLPKHTFYVDNIYVYAPLGHVEKMYYLDVDLYHYFIGREDQSVQESVMIRRIDQNLKVNRMLFDAADPFEMDSIPKRNYMLNYLEIITTVSSVLLIKSGTEENLKKKDELWEYIRQKNPAAYRVLRRRFFGRALHLRGKAGRRFVLILYGISRKIFGFN